MKIFISGGSTTYANWIKENFTVTQSMSMADLVMFTGGADINSHIYGKIPHPKAQLPIMSRDAIEKRHFTDAMGFKIPMIGICRGAQFLCAMSGGLLVQHMEHPSRHWITCDDGNKYLVTSDHHQLQFPFDMEPSHYRLIGYAEGLSPRLEGETSNDLMVPDLTDSLKSMEPEIVYYTKTKALAIQSHPEWMIPPTTKEEEASLAYLNLLLKQLLGDKL